MGYLTNPQGELSNRGVAESVPVWLDIGAPISGSTLELGIMPSTFQKQRSLARVQWNQAMSSATFVLPTDIDTLVMPGIMSPREVHTLPFNAIHICAGFYNTACDFYNASSDSVEIMRNNPLEDNEVLRAAALDGLWKAVLDKLRPKNLIH